MRYRRPGNHRRWPLRLWAKLALAAGAVAVLWFNDYVDQEIKPTMMRIAEYEARRITTQALHEAVEGLDFGGQLYQVEDGYASLDAAAANRARSALIAAAETQLAALEEQEFSVPFGSLTGNYLLNGQGPGWNMRLLPEGYVQAAWEQDCETLAINTTRYTASLVLSVTVNMILDGRTETLTVEEPILIADLLLRGDTPNVYAAALD